MSRIVMFILKKLEVFFRSVTGISCLSKKIAVSPAYFASSGVEDQKAPL